MSKEVKTKEAVVSERFPTNSMVPPKNKEEIEARIAANPEIMERIAQGDHEAVTDYFFLMGASSVTTSERFKPE